MTLNDLWVDYLEDLGYSGDINTMLYEALRDRTGLDYISINDLWQAFLEMKGQPSIYEWLEDLGHTQLSINDRWLAALMAGDIFEDGQDENAWQWDNDETIEWDNGEPVELEE